MLDQLLKKVGLTRFENLEKMYDAVEEALYDIRVTYDFMNDLLNYDLPPDVKIEVNKYIAEHEWVAKNVTIVIDEQE